MQCIQIQAFDKNIFGIYNLYHFLFSTKHKQPIVTGRGYLRPRHTKQQVAVTGLSVVLLATENNTTHSARSVHKQ